MAKKGILNTNEIESLRESNTNLKKDNIEYKRAYNQGFNGISDLKDENKKLKIKLNNSDKLEKAMYGVLKEHNLIPEAQEKLNKIKNDEKNLKKAPSIDLTR